MNNVIDKRIPVTLLTGFLGAGKTTLLNHLIKHPDMAGAAVLINEFGEVGIDHHLVEKVDDSLVILESGCICCNVQGDLVTAMKTLAQRSSRGEIPPVSRVLIETTGLADPVPVIYTLTQERFVAARYQCDGVITAVDATRALPQLDEHQEALRQVAMADRLLITKCDLVDTGSRAVLQERLRALNPSAAHIEVSHGQIHPRALHGCGIYTTVGKAPDVAGWLAEEQVRAMQSCSTSVNSAFIFGKKGSHAAHAHGHARERHDHTVTSFVVNLDDPAPWYGFALAMGRILRDYGPNILRVKGLMNIEGDPLPRVIQCVQDVAYPPASLAKWPEQNPFDARQGRMVFIVRGLHRKDVDAIRSALASLEHDAARVRKTIARETLPTRCWFSHHASSGGSSAIQLGGWMVQPKRLGVKLT